MFDRCDGRCRLVAGYGIHGVCFQTEHLFIKSSHEQISIDKDAASALLAKIVEADALLLLTDVDAVYVGWGTSGQKPISKMTSEELKERRFESR